MMSTRPAGPTFREGDEVVLAQGTYPGTLGAFLRLKEDVNWADITERNGDVRSRDMAGSFRERDSGFRELTPP